MSQLSITDRICDLSMEIIVAACENSCSANVNIFLNNVIDLYGNERIGSTNKY